MFISRSLSRKLHCRLLLLSTLITTPSFSQTTFPTPTVQALNTSGRDELRRQDNSEMPVCETRATIDSGCLVGKSNHVLISLSLERATEAFNANTQLAQPRMLLERRLVAVNLGSGAATQLKLDVLETDEFLVQCNYALEGSQLGVTVVRKSDVIIYSSTLPEDRKVKFFRWDLDNNTIRDEQRIDNGVGADLFGILSPEVYRVRIGPGSIGIAELQSTFEIEIKGLYDLISNISTDSRLFDRNYFVGAPHEHGLLIFRNTAKDLNEPQLELNSFHPANNWQLTSDTLRQFVGKPDRYVFGVAPVFGSLPDNQTVNLVVEIEERKLGKAQSIFLLSIAKKDGSLVHCEELQFNMLFRVPVVSNNGKWIAFIGMSERPGVYDLPDETRIALMDLKDNSVRYYVVRDWVSLIGVADDGHVIATDGRAVFTYFPESAFAKASLFELWPARMNNQR